MTMSNTVPFGFEDIAPEDKTARVGAVFRSVARRYDIMNDVMSAGQHRLWKDVFVSRVHPRASETILDLAGGTGDIAFRLAKSGADIIVSDINPDMLAVGRERATRRGLDRLAWIEANAETLTPFADRQFDAVTIAFGIRNVTDIPAALDAIHRVLKFGGRFYCLEFSQISLPLLADLYRLYAHRVVPKAGALIARDRDSYQYLVESIERFPGQDAFSAMIRAAGFTQVRAQPLLGGLVIIHSGWKS